MKKSLFILLLLACCLLSNMYAQQKPVVADKIFELIKTNNFEELNNNYLKETDINESELSILKKNVPPLSDIFSKNTYTKHHYNGLFAIPLVGLYYYDAKIANKLYTINSTVIIKLNETDSTDNKLYGITTHSHYQREWISAKNDIKAMHTTKNYYTYSTLSDKEKQTKAKTADMYLEYIKKMNEKAFFKNCLGHLTDDEKKNLHDGFVVLSQQLNDTTQWWVVRSINIWESMEEKPTQAYNYSYRLSNNDGNNEISITLDGNNKIVSVTLNYLEHNFDWKRIKENKPAEMDKNAINRMIKIDKQGLADKKIIELIRAKNIEQLNKMYFNNGMPEKKKTELDAFLNDIPLTLGIQYKKKPMTIFESDKAFVGSIINKIVSDKIYGSSDGYIKIEHSGLDTLISNLIIKADETYTIVTDTNKVKDTVEMVSKADSLMNKNWMEKKNLSLKIMNYLKAKNYDAAFQLMPKLSLKDKKYILNKISKYETVLAKNGYSDINNDGSHLVIIQSNNKEELLYYFNYLITDSQEFKYRISMSFKVKSKAKASNVSFVFFKRWIN